MSDRRITQINELIQSARELSASHRPTVIIAGADDPLTLAAACNAYREKLIEGVLVGPAESIRRAGGEIGVDLDPFELFDTALSSEEITERSLDRLSDGTGDLIMKGRLKTGDLLKGYLNHDRGFRTGRFLSHLGVFNAPQERRLMIITDGGLNISPDLKRKLDILKNAVDIAHLLGIDCPRIAILAHVEKSPDHDLAMIRDAEELTRMNREGLLNGCLVDGPLALDNAVSPVAAARKGISGLVAGKADILLANEIGMGNVIYKTVQIWLNGAIAGVVAGGRFPVITPSRADSEESKLAAIALGILMVGEKRLSPYSGHPCGHPNEKLNRT